MKRTWTILLAGLLIAALTAPALAWEFEMTGEAEFRYRYFARQGQADLFGGPAGYNAGGATGTIGFAGPVNNVVRAQGFSAKGGDASISDNRIWLFPDIRVNPAIRLRGEYWVTGTNLRGLYDGAGAGTAFPTTSWTLPTGYNGWYIESDGTNGNRTTPSGMSIGMWEKLWMTAQTPWGILAVGRRPFAFGLGWSAAHERDLDTESWLLVAPYGPFNFGLYFHTRVVGGDNFVANSAAGQATVTPTGAVTPANGIWAGGTDKNRARNDFGEWFTYRNGPVELGMFQEYVLYPDQHTNLITGTVNGASVPAGPAGGDDFSNAALPALFLGTGVVPGTITPIYGDINFVFGINYFKYFNGRFFFNAEYDYQYADITRKGGRPLTWYGEAWMLEGGIICGPSKLSLGAWRSSGHDRRGGLLNVTQATGATTPGVFTYDKFNLYLGFSDREQTLQQYVWLFGIYGGGNNGYGLRGKPTWQDLMAYGARLDYAVAANLNVSGSFFYARRDSNTGTAIASFGGGVVPTTNPRAIVPTLAGGAVPNVPDDYLGWEADAGVNWKLLEGMTFNALFAYWQPGDWFKWAYIDYGSLTTTTAGGLAGLPVNPNRAIDPIIGFQTSVVVDF